MSEDNYDIHRGKIGLASFGKIDIQVNLFETRPPEYMPNNGTIDSEQFIDSIKFTTTAVESYCSKKFSVVEDNLLKALCNTALG